LAEDFFRTEEDFKAFDSPMGVQTMAKKKPRVKKIKLKHVTSLSSS